MPENEWVHITLVNEYTRTKLYVNDELVSELAREADKGNKWATLITPIEKIGSETNAFEGMIDDLVISKKDAQEMPENVRALAGKLAEAKEELAKTDVYTEASLAALQVKVEAAEAVLADWENADVDLALNELTKAIEDLEKNGDTKPVAKEDLEALIKYAKEAQKDPSYKYVVKKVREMFEQALADANKVNGNAAATQAEVDAAYDALLKTVHLLEFKGNMERLEALVVTARKETEEMYTPKSWEPFAKALQEAEKILEEGNTLQAEVDAARETLLNAIFGLREVPNKDKLNELLAKVKAMDLKVYSEGTASAVKAAYAKAMAVFEDKNADQTQVDAAVAALEKAVKATNAEVGTGEKPDTSDKSNVSDEKDDNKVASDNAGSKTNKTAGNTAAKTGDSANTAVPAAGLAAILAAIIAWKKKVN